MLLWLMLLQMLRPSNLQGILNSLPADIIVLVLDDFNAQIGKRKMEDDVWREIRGLYSIGTCNEAGEQPNCVLIII